MTSLLKFSETEVSVFKTISKNSNYFILGQMPNNRCTFCICNFLNAINIPNISTGSLSIEYHRKVSVSIKVSVALHLLQTFFMFHLRKTIK